MQLHESAGDESAETSFENDEALERYPQVALKILDKTQPEMSNVEDRLLHTLYTTTKVCAFCHQLFDDVPAIARRREFDACARGGVYIVGIAASAMDTGR